MFVLTRTQTIMIKNMHHKLIASFCTMVLAAATCQAASPTLRRITPAGVQRGTETELILSGTFLDDAIGLIFYQPGVELLEFSPGKNPAPTRMQAKVRVAADCPLGEHQVRVRTKSGISEISTFFVGALPQVREKEPNNDFAEPQSVALNTTVEGVANTEDDDYYVVEAKKGQRISVEVEGMRLGNTMFDPYIAILNSKRFEMARSDDTALLKQDGCLSVVAPEDGKYIVQVRETSYAGNGACTYRLHIGTFPRPIAVYPAGGKLGEEIEVDRKSVV